MLPHIDYRGGHNFGGWSSTDIDVQRIQLLPMHLSLRHHIIHDIGGPLSGPALASSPTCAGLFLPPDQHLLNTMRLNHGGLPQILSMKKVSKSKPNSE